MKEKRECEIVQDLLPNYMENLTSIQTNKYIEEHIANCGECKGVLENMQKEVPTDAKVKNKKEVKYMKKYRNKMRTLSFILLAIFLVFIGITTRKAVIISDLSQKAEETMKSTNYHKTTYTYDKGRAHKSEEFILGDKRKKITTVISEEGIIKIQEFETKDSDIETRTNAYMVQDNKKTARLNSVTYHWQATEEHNPLYTENIIHLLVNAGIFSNVRETIFEGKECYVINNFKGLYTLQPEGTMYINKENGLVICSMDSEIDDGFGGKLKFSGCEIEYEFGTVKEEDFIEPDISEYEIQK